MSDNFLQQNKFSRRAALKGTASAAVMMSFAPNAVLACKPTDVPQSLLRVTSVLTGIDVNKSFIELGVRIWHALLRDVSELEKEQWEQMIKVLEPLPEDATQGQIEAALAPLGSQGMAKAQQLTRVWYTGRIERGDTFEVIDYDDALVWLACNFTKPPTTCGGHFGYWQKPFEGESYD